MSTLGPGEIQARRRPFVVLSIAGLRLVCGFCLAFPLASLIGASGIGQRGEGDRALFEGGGYLLLEVVRLQGPELMAAVRGLIPLFGVGLLLTALCNAALLVTLSKRGRLDLRDVLAAALERWPGLLVIGAGTGLGQALLFGVGAAVVAAVPDSMSKPVATSVGQLGAWLVVAALAGALGGFSDVSKACFVRNDAKLTTALAQGFVCAVRRPLSACFGWLPYAFLFGGAVLAAAQLTEALDVSQPGAWRIALVWLLHEAVVVISVALRATWFARALRLAAVTAS